MVAGLGESIVSGLVPGSALGAVVSKADTANPQARAFTVTVLLLSRLCVLALHCVRGSGHTVCGVCYV